MTKFVSVRYPEEGYKNKTLVLVIEGYPTDIIEEVYKVAGNFLSSLGAWHFVSLVLDSPMISGYGYKRDDCWVLTAIAELKS